MARRSFQLTDTDVRSLTELFRDLAAEKPARLVLEDFPEGHVILFIYDEVGNEIGFATLQPE